MKKNSYLEAQMRYRKQSRQVSINFNLHNDRDKELYEKLCSVKNKSKVIKDLIDMYL